MSNPYIKYHSYNIAEMIDTYEIFELKIDDILAMFMILKVLSLYERDRGRIAEENRYNIYLFDLINAHNKNKRTVDDSDKETIGTINNAI